MNNLSQYIIEKLHINKNSKIKQDISEYTLVIPKSERAEECFNVNFISEEVYIDEIDTFGYVIHDEILSEFIDNNHNVFHRDELRMFCIPLKYKTIDEFKKAICTGNETLDNLDEY